MAFIETIPYQNQKILEYFENLCKYWWENVKQDVNIYWQNMSLSWYYFHFFLQISIRILWLWHGHLYKDSLTLALAFFNSLITINFLSLPTTQQFILSCIYFWVSFFHHLHIFILFVLIRMSQNISASKNNVFIRLIQSNIFSSRH